MIEIMGDFNLTQAKNTPTEGKDILDLILTNNPGLKTTPDVVPGWNNLDAVLCYVNVKLNTLHFVLQFGSGAMNKVRCH